MEIYLIIYVLIGFFVGVNYSSYWFANHRIEYGYTLNQVFESMIYWVVFLFSTILWPLSLIDLLLAKINKTKKRGKRV